jgi:hypothetical protein
MSTLQAIAIIVGVVSGVSGLALGILNYIHQRDKSRPRLAVRVQVPDPKYPSIQQKLGLIIIDNVGQVPVMMRDYLFFDPPRGRKRGGFAVKVAEDDELKGELKPQHKMMLTFTVDAMPKVRDLGRAFVMTAIGDKFKATRRDMRKLIEHRRVAEISPPPPTAPCTPPQAPDTPA